MQEYVTIMGKLLTPINRKKFKAIVDKYKGDFAAKKITCWEQFVAILLGQFSNNKNSSLRDIVSLLEFHAKDKYHLGIKHKIARSTLSDANRDRDWRIYRDLFLSLIDNLRTDECIETDNLIKIIDSSPIRLKILEHPWIERTLRIEGIKLHLIYDLTNTIPVYFEFSGAKTEDIEVAKKIEIQPNTTYVMDRGYMDFNWWNEIDEKGAYFVTRLKRNNAIIELSEIEKIDEQVSCQLIKLKRKNLHCGNNNMSEKVLRRVIVQRENNTPLVIVSNDLNRSPKEIAELYKQRWQIELFFKWIKQNLKIKKFLGKSENAIKTQICIALIGYILLRLSKIVKYFLTEISKKMSLKTIFTIIQNNLFTKLKIAERGRKKWNNPDQLHFNFCLEL